ncbi:DHS-like NAD/FAD-binding domain-containing protein [Venturia nashicola]|nr:DHS-like NAD/FAD-binding domain-containing protein [Venturia nashicola]
MKPNTPSTMHDGYESDNSSRLSVLSHSPSPPPADNYPRDYPSPVSSEDSQLSELGSTPSPDDMANTPPSSQNRDNPSPAKKRRLNEPKFKPCEHVDISSGELSGDAQIQLERLLKVIHKKRKIVVVAGAGISVSAGIPDFRSSTGLFKTLKSEHNLKSSGKDLFDAAVYKDDDSTTTFHTMVRSLATTTRSASATPFHHMLATLAHEGRLLRLYTQNVDGIDTSLPPLSTSVPLERKAPWPKTVQLHGSLEKMVCTKCHQTSDLEPEIFDGPVPPTCPTCEESDGVRTQHAGKRSHGIGRLRPRMVLYNEHNPDDEAIGSVVKADMRTRPDALIVVGTTLKVPGVKRIVKEMSAIVRDRKDGGMAVWINNDDPPKDLEWNLVVRGPCDFVAASAALRKWNDPDHVEVTAEEVERIKAAKEVKVIINNSPSKNRFLDRAAGVPTPAPSPILAPVDSKKKPSTIQTTIAPKKQPAKKAATGAKAKKPAATKKKTVSKKAAAKANTIKFPASKPNVQVVAKAEKPAKLHMMADIKAAPQKRKAGSSEEDPPVFQPVSPSAARNNSNPPFKSPHHQTVTPRKKSYSDERGFPLGRSEIPSSPSLPARPSYSPISSPVRERDLKSFDQPVTPIQEDYAEHPVRESPEERNRIVTPTGPIPKGMSDILN